MIGPDFLLPAEPGNIPLVSGMLEGDRMAEASLAALPHLLAARASPRLTSDAVVAQVAGLIDDLAERLAHTSDRATASLVARIALDLREDPAVLAHCHALALEWLLALRLEHELGLDPVTSPGLASWVADGEGARAELAMASLAAQSRFAQNQRRMELPLEELPAELLHAALTCAIGAMTPGEADLAKPRHKAIRSAYDEASTRLAILARLAETRGHDDAAIMRIEDTGLALWLSLVAARSHQDRTTLVRASASDALERLLLTLRAAGLNAGEVQRQVLQIQPDAELPKGLDEIGTREAAQWLSGTGR